MKTHFALSVACFLSILIPSSAAEIPERTVWNLVSGGTDKWIQTFCPHVKDGDIILIPEGNGGTPVDMGRALKKFHRVSSNFQAAGRKNVTFGVYTSDLENVKEVAKGLQGEAGISLIGYGYEINYGREFPKGSDMGWKFDNALANVRKAASYAHAAGKRLMVIPNGRTLEEPDLFKYHWDYADFINKAGADFMLVQTQTWVLKGKFEAAIDKLAGQLQVGHVPLDKVIPQVTVEPRQVSNRNGVDAATAFQAVKTARQRGFYSMSFWFAYLDLDSPLQYVKMVESLGR